jgi:hypothetical protein
MNKQIALDCVGWIKAIMRAVTAPANRSAFQCCTFEELVALFARAQ